MRRLSRTLVGLICALVLLATGGAVDVAGGSFALPAYQTGGDLLITEVYYDTPGADEEEEWIELANLGANDISLEGYGLGDEEEPGGGEGMVRFPPGAAIGPGEVIVVAQTAVGFQRLFGRQPAYEIKDSDPHVPDMAQDSVWATGSLALNNSGDEVLLLNDRDAIVDAVSYGNSDFFFTPGAAGVPRGHSIERAPAHCDSDSAADWKPATAPTPGEAFLEGACIQAADVLEDGVAPAIGVIQGAGHRSPLLNQVVTFRGVVTGVQEDRNARGVIFYTMFVQDRPEAADGDPDTSDAIPVFLALSRPPAQPGDEVLVSGRVTEFYGLTEIDHEGLQVQVLSQDNELPAPVSLAGIDDRDELEALEGMRVSLPPAPVVGPTFSGCGFAVAPGAGPAPRLIRETNEENPGFIVPVLHHSDVDCRGFPQVKVGDVVEGLSGPLTYHFDEFKIVVQSTQDLPVHADPLPEPPSPPSLAAGEFSAATFNLHDYFDPVDHTGADAEPKPTLEELRRKQSKLSAVIGRVLGCPTLLGVQEVEHEALLLELADLLRPRCGFLYQVSHRESADARGIDVALLSQPQRVRVQDVRLRQACGEPAGDGAIDAAHAEATCEQGAPPLFSRPPLVVDLLLDDKPYTVYVNHFKSKREGELETAPLRQAQAAFLRALIDKRLAQDAEARLIVMGDFNDYPQSAPLQTLVNGRESGSTTVLYDAMRSLPREQRYTYIFSGVSQLLDTILLSPALAERMTWATIAHVNADYPAGLAADDTVPFHASDHDVPLVVMQGGDVPATPTPQTTTPAPATSTPVAGTPVVEKAASQTPIVETPTALPSSTPPAATSTAHDASAAPEPNRGWLYAALALLPVVVLVVFVVYGRRR